LKKCSGERLPLLKVVDEHFALATFKKCKPIAKLSLVILGSKAKVPRPLADRASVALCLAVMIESDLKIPALSLRVLRKENPFARPRRSPR
jgi:hypothetical protein